MHGLMNGWMFSQYVFKDSQTSVSPKHPEVSPLVAICSTAVLSRVQEKTTLKGDNSLPLSPKPSKSLVSGADHPCNEV